MQKQGLTRSYALSLLRSKFESEERHQEVEYVEDLIGKEAEKQEQEFKLPPTGTTQQVQQQRKKKWSQQISLAQQYQHRQTKLRK